MVLQLNLGVLLLLAGMSILIVYMAVENTNSDAEFPSISSFSTSPTPDLNPQEEEEQEWNFGNHKNEQKWLNQMRQRGWTKEEITEAIKNGESFSAANNVNAANGVTRFVHPSSGKSVVIDNVTKELLHIGKAGFLY